MKFQIQFTLILLISIVLIGCTTISSENNDTKADKNNSVSFILDWTPNTNHTGIYVAKEKGFYEEFGIEVDILLPGEVGAEQLVATNKGNFGISFQHQVTQARAEQLPVVSIAAVMQHYTAGYASPMDRNIISPKDFAGKVYGAYGSVLEESMINFVMERDNADGEDVQIVQLGNTDFFMATKKDIDFVSIFYGWTGIEAELKDVEINFIQPTDYAKELDMYSPVIITNEEMIEKDPETVQKFVDATLKGYEFAIENPSEAAQILIAAEPDLDPELVKRSQAWVSPRYQDDAEHWGIQDIERWATFAQFMFDNGIIEKEIDAEKAFTNKFLENAR